MLFKAIAWPASLSQLALQRKILLVAFQRRLIFAEVVNVTPRLPATSAIIRRS